MKEKFCGRRGTEKSQITSPPPESKSRESATSGLSYLSAYERNMVRQNSVQHQRRINAFNKKRPKILGDSAQIKKTSRKDDIHSWKYAGPRLKKNSYRNDSTESR